MCRQDPEAGVGMSPQRIQRKRAKGWRMPVSTVYVGRPTRWGNRFAASSGCVLARPWSEVRARPLLAGVYRAGDEVIYSCHAPAERAIEHAVDLFRAFCEVEQRDYRNEFNAWLYPLRGRDLACWCRLDQPCHADVLLDLANCEVSA